MKWIRFFRYSAGAILLLAALERILVAVGEAQSLSRPEPMLVIPLRFAVMLVGGLELVAAINCLFGKRAGLPLGWVAWLASNYTVYRVGLVAIGVHHQGTCIGSLTNPLHLTGGIAGGLVALLPVYLLLGSYAALLWLWLESRRAKAAKYVKMSCPACGIHIRFDDRNVGQKMPCPHCQAAITLHRPGNLKMSCYFCKEHIEFPAHATGTKLPCPHCNMGITLKAA